MEKQKNHLKLKKKNNYSLKLDFKYLQKILEDNF